MSKKPRVIKVPGSTATVTVFDKIVRPGGEPTTETLFNQANKFLTEIGERASVDGAALVLMAMHTERAITETLIMLNLWAKRAPKHSQPAWLTMVSALTRGVTALNGQAMDGDSKALKSIAKTLAVWPCVVSPNSGLERNSPQRQTLLECLKLGKDNPRKMVNSKWRTNTPIGKVADELWWLIYRVRSGERLDVGLASPLEDQHFRALAKRLPDFLEVGGYKKWLKLAEHLFKHQLADPALSKVLLSSSKSKEKLTSHGRRKAYLLTSLQNQFKSMAGENKWR